MFSLIYRIKNALTNKKTLLEWSQKTKFMEENRIAYCLGVNQEGVKCPRALSCSRYTKEKINSETYLNFPPDYDIKNCEVFAPTAQNQLQ
jgi:hypothetical protein